MLLTLLLRYLRHLSSELVPLSSWILEFLCNKLLWVSLLFIFLFFLTSFGHPNYVWWFFRDKVYYLLCLLLRSLFPRLSNKFISDRFLKGLVPVYACNSMYFEFLTLSSSQGFFEVVLYVSLTVFSFCFTLRTFVVLFSLGNVTPVEVFR